MLTKDGLRNEFRKNWKEHYELDIFKEKGFMRKQCEKCKRFFWTTDAERSICSDSGCEEYGFIGAPVTREKTDYIETWKKFENFFKKEGHEVIPRYPVVDRWRPDLYFTIASIQDFQRIDNGKTVMEYPADPLIVPQVCLRFNDIPNVGVTGRHHTSFIMGGQHSFGNYWKDRCIELNFNFLNKEMGIPEDKLVYMEDVWSMPDFSQFGPCIETFSMGLELVNSVFSQFTKSGNSFEELPQKVIDVGWGHERLVWFSNGTFNGYEAVFGPVINWMKKEAGIGEDKLFERYSKLAGGLDFDEVKDIRGAKNKIAERLGVNITELNKVIGPMQALYAIADHTKTLLFASADGGIPSNVGGGYNLRVLLRRSLGFMDEYNFDFEIEKIAEKHADFLKPLFPELPENVSEFSKIFGIEKQRYKNTLKRSKQIISKEIKGNEIDEKTMETLYVSHGITPELIEEIAGKDKKIQISDDFYKKITESHMSNEAASKKELKFDLSGIDKTEFLFYSNPYQKDFNAKVIKIIKNKKGNWVVLDKTLFYPEGGGQPSDMGMLNNVKVLKVEKQNGVALHMINGELHEGDEVRGEINWKRRYELMKMHSSTHILSGSARKIFGKHIWQAGAHKDINSSRIDLTHYLPFSNEDLEKIERMSNETIEKEIPIDSAFMPRSEAEEKFGFILYQGGASPGKTVRVINIHKGDEIHDVEACGGTHLTNTKEAQMIKIIKTERIQDGVNRIEFVAGEAALKFVENEKKVYEDILNQGKAFFKEHIQINPTIDHYKISHEIQQSADVFSVGRDIVLMTFNKFMNSIKEQDKKLKTGLSERLKEIGFGKIQNISEISKAVFELWKYQKKLIEKEMEESIDDIVKVYETRINGEKLIQIADFERKILINLAQRLSEKNPEAIIIFANKKGDIIAKSATKDVREDFNRIIQNCNGNGGGRADFCQGKIKNIEKFEGINNI